MTTDDLAIARILERDIILANGIEGACGCMKFALCPFPNTSWYYVAACMHDDSSMPPPHERSHWWFDLTERCMVSLTDFQVAFRVAIEVELNPTRLRRLVSEDPGPGPFVSVIMGPRLLYIASGGQVRQVYPTQVPRDGGWI